MNPSPSLGASSALLIVLLLPSSASAQTFAAENFVGGGANRVGVVTADFDGDGDEDFASGGGTVTVFWSNGDGTGNHAVIPSSIQPFANGGIAAGDLEQDGDFDLVAANGVGAPVQGAPGILFHRNQGSQTFTQSLSVTTPLFGTRDPVLGDVDGNGSLDLVFQYSVGGNIVIWTNDGTGAFTPGASYPKAGTSIQDLTLADVDNDGDLDLASGQFNGGDAASIRIRRNDGSGTFGADEPIAAGGTEANGIEFADTDSDGDLDLLVARPDLDDVGLFENDGSGSFAAPVSILAGTDPWTTTTADLNDDGWLDVAAPRATGPGVLEVVLGQGGGTFGAPESHTTGNLAFSLGHADLNQDGDRELVVVHSGGTSLFENLTDPLLTADSLTLSLVTGGSHELTLRAGASHASELYWVLGSLSGTSPGFGGLPLNVDAYFLFTLNSPNLLIQDQLAFLDAGGQGTATLTLPAGLDPGLAGARFDHAYAAIELAGFTTTAVSNPVGMKLVP